MSQSKILNTKVKKDIDKLMNSINWYYFFLYIFQSISLNLTAFIYFEFLFNQNSLKIGILFTRFLFLLME